MEPVRPDVCLGSLAPARIIDTRETRHWRCHLDEVVELESPSRVQLRSALADLLLFGCACCPYASTIPLHAGRGDAEVGRRVLDTGTVLSPP